MIVADVIKVFVPASVAFLIGIALTPILTHYLYKYRMWKKRGGKMALGGAEASVFNSLHKNKEVGTPRLGGVVIWGSTLLTAAGLFLLAKLFDAHFTELDLLSRSQTWLPLFALLAGAVVGLIDDFFEIRESAQGQGGLALWKRLFVVALVSGFAAWWFYSKLDVVALHVPFWGDVFMGWLIIPFFIFVALCIYAGGIIDGIDGLAGGVFASIFSSYAIIAFYQNQIDLAALSATLAGGTLAFLWFNIPPARFYMSETGTMGLTLALTVIAFMTDTLGEGSGVLVLPLIAFPLTLTVVSVTLQILSKRLRGKKLFHIAPLHHHFEAIGWPNYKVAMRYWVISAICAILGATVALIG